MACRTLSLIVLILCLWGTACNERSLTGPSLTPAPSSPAPAPTTEPFAGPVTGKYFGTAPTPIAYLTGVPLFQMALEVRQVDSTVRGSWGIVDFPDGGPVEGIVVEGRIVLRLTSADSDLRIDGTLSAADGSAFSATLGFCYTCVDPVQPVAVSFSRQ
jgi:hypothetical protein